MEYNFEKILAEYRTKKTPDGRRDCIARCAALTGRQKSEISAALLAAGQQVDGRLVKNLKNARPRTVPDSAALPGWQPVQEVAAEPEPEPEPEPAPETGADAGEFAEDTNVPGKPEPAPPGMTVATLRQMLDGVAGEALILVGDDLAPCVRAEFQAHLDAKGQRTYCHLALMGF